MTSDIKQVTDNTPETADSQTAGAEVKKVGAETTEQLKDAELDVAESGKDQAVSDVVAKTTAEISAHSRQVNQSEATGAETQSFTDLSKYENMDQSTVESTVNDLENENFKIVVDAVLAKYKYLSSGISSAEGNRQNKKELKHWLKENIKNLEKIKKDMSKNNYDNLATYKGRVGALIYYFNHYEQVRQIITLGGWTSDIPAIIDSQRDAKRARKYEKRDAKHQQKMNEILHSTALTSLLTHDQERYEEYLKLVLNQEINPSTHPFYTANKVGFDLIRDTNPNLYGVIAPTLPDKISYDVYCQRNGKNTACQKETFNNRLGKGMTDLLAKVFPGIDSDPRKRQAREQASSVVALGGAVVLGFQFFKNLFSNKEKNADKWRNVGIYGGSLLALLNAGTLIDWGKDAFGIHPADKTKFLAESFQKYGFSDTQALNISEKYIGAPVATMSALHFIPLYDLVEKNILENSGGQIKFNYTNYEKYINEFDRDVTQKNQALAAGKKLDQDKSVGAGLKAFGIATRDRLKSLGSGDKNKTLAQTDGAENGWANMVEKVNHGINKVLRSHGLRIKDPDDVENIMSEYDEADKNPDSQKGLIKTWIKANRLELADPETNYTLGDMLKNPNVDLENMSMKGFTNNGGMTIKFDNYKELFDTVHLTDWIKENFKGRPANSASPFHISALGYIEFNNTDRYELWKNETDVIKRRTIKKTSSLLSKNKQFYVDYLNDWRESDGKAG